MNSTLENKDNSKEQMITLGKHKVSVETFTHLTDNQRERMINGKQTQKTNWSR